MILGTAGLTAALCMEKLEWMNAQPQDCPVLVTGATGGVGSVAVSLLASLGFEVVAMTGKEAQHDYLKALGASEIVSREGLGEVSARPMLKPAFAHAIDTVGGDILTNVVKSLQPQGSVAICGLVASANFDVSVLPFQNFPTIRKPLCHLGCPWGGAYMDIRPGGATFLQTSASSANIPPTVLEHQPQNRFSPPPPTIQRQSS